MKVGDLVRRSESHKVWALVNEWNYPERDQGLGVVVDWNGYKHFVYWFEEAVLRAHDEQDLEMISESR